MSKEFASGYDKDENGWYLFPRDTTWRKSIMPQEVMEHPSKMNMHLCEAIIEYVSEPGETIVDCFGGIGTTLIGALTKRNIFTIELEEEYVKLQKEIVSKWLAEGKELGDTVILHGDNRAFLPIPTDHMIFSPPYANDMAKTTGGALNEDIQRQVDQYTDSTLNLGRLNEFFYRQAMEKIYQGVADSVRSGGTVSITHRDRSRAGRRILFGDSIVRALTTKGFILSNWFKWAAPGSFQSRVNEARGAKVILDEDILIFKKN